MKFLKLLTDGKLQIQKDLAFCSLLDFKLPIATKEISELFEEFDNLILAENNTVTTGALSNTHGDWYEWLIAIAAWNAFVDLKQSHCAILLPNISQFDVAKLYVPTLSFFIDDLRQKVLATDGVKLITSNPDFVVFNAERVKARGLKMKKIETINVETISELQSMYKNFIGKCEFEDIEGFIAVKTSLRPDRRLQISHEGSLMKALYVHLQTRQWITNPKGLKYYAIATRIGVADREALKTVATHSITTVQSLPQAAVDEVFEINSLKQADDSFRKILEV